MFTLSSYMSKLTKPEHPCRLFPRDKMLWYALISVSSYPSDSRTVSDRCYESNKSILVEGAELFLGVLAVHVADGRPAERGEAPVDAAHLALDVVLQRLVLRHVHARRHRHLLKGRANLSGMQAYPCYKIIEDGLCQLTFPIMY